MRKTRIVFWLCVTVIGCLLSIPSCAQTEYVNDTSKYCFNLRELNFWVGCAYDSHTYRNIIDSLQIIQRRCDLKIFAKDYEIKEAKELLNSKDTLIFERKKESELLKAELKKERKWKSFWKTSSGIIFGSSVLLASYQEMKN